MHTDINKISCNIYILMHSKFVLREFSHIRVCRDVPKTFRHAVLESSQFPPPSPPLSALYVRRIDSELYERMNN